MGAQRLIRTYFRVRILSMRANVNNHARFGESSHVARRARGSAALVRGWFLCAECLSHSFHGRIDVSQGCLRLGSSIYSSETLSLIVQDRCVCGAFKFNTSLKELDFTHRISRLVFECLCMTKTVPGHYIP